jgi:cystathionine beta-lyase/cystathionine gamma-synthase
MGSKTKKMRYIVQIMFLETSKQPFFRLWDIHEYVKTLKEARSYESAIDHTVAKARVVDAVKEKVVIQWK